LLACDEKSDENRSDKDAGEIGEGGTAHRSRNVTATIAVKAIED
jgi:hypothetical protein